MAGRYLMLLVTVPVDTAAGVLLMLAPRELFPAHARTGRARGPSVLADPHNGEIGSDFIMTVVALGSLRRSSMIHARPASWVVGRRHPPRSPATGNAGRKDVRSGSSRHRR
jgi:hypothetical protein